MGTSIPDNMFIERQRLGLTLQQVADHMQTGRSSVHRWETLSHVSSIQLAQLAEIGYDPLFIVTGERSHRSDDQASDKEGISELDSRPLSAAEMKWLRLVREMPNDEIRKKTFGVIKAIAEGEGIDTKRATKPKNKVTVKGKKVRYAGRDYHEKK